MGTRTWSLVVGASVICLACGRFAAGEEPLPATASEAVPADTDLSAERMAALEQEHGLGTDATVSPVTAGWDKEDGFFISDKEKQYFLLKIGGRVQIRYTYKGRDRRGDTTDEGELTGNPDDPDERFTGEVGDRDESYFELERARLYFGGHVISPNLTYYAQLEADTDSDGFAKMLDYYVLYRAGEIFSENNPDFFAIGAGQWKPHFLRQEATSSGKLQMVDRSLANEFFNIDRTLGLWVQGDMDPIFYQLAMTNGFDSANVSHEEVDQIPAFIAKLDFNLLGHTRGKYEESNVKDSDTPTWVFGLSGATDQNNGTAAVDGERYKCIAFGIDTQFTYSLFSLQAEYMGRWLDYEAGSTAVGAPAGTGSGEAFYTHGFYVQGGMFLMPSQLELVGRVSAVIPDSGPADGHGVEAGPGLNWYISHSHKVKLQTDLIYFDISNNMPNATESLNDSVPEFESGAANLMAGEQGIMWRMQLQLQF